MRTNLKIEKLYLMLVDYVLPLPLTIIMFYLWYFRTGNYSFAAYIMVLGILFGYTVPGIATNLFHLWSFNRPLKVGKYLIHHGFIYAPYLALVFYVSFPENTTLSVGNIIRVLLCNAFIQSVVSCHHDICALKTGFVHIKNSASFQNKSAIEVITDFGVVGFGIIGASFAGSCLLAYNSIILSKNESLSHWLFLFIIGFILMAFCSIPYIIKERTFINPKVIKYLQFGK